MRKFIPLILIALPGCSALMQPNTVPCAAALLQSPAQSAGDYFKVAQTIPSCKMMALEILQEAVADAMAKRQ
jgi:hypothetical protein